MTNSIFAHTDDKQILDVYTPENKSLILDDGYLRMRLKFKNREKEVIFIIMPDTSKVRFTKYIPFIENKLKTEIYEEKYKLGSRANTCDLKKSYVYTLLGWMKEYDFK